MAIFVDQKLTITLTALDNDGEIINLGGLTVHFLTKDPDGNETIDTTPTIADPTTGEVAHVYIVGALGIAGDWDCKTLIDGDEIPSTKYTFHVYELWER